MSGTYDYVIVGGGTAGCVLASRLSADPANRVLLLEAGGSGGRLRMRMPLGFPALKDDPATDWCYSTEPEPHAAGRRLPRVHGKGLGGSSSINGMTALRGHPLDYDEWRALGLAGWGHADLLPYFRRAETSWRGAGPLHGGDGPWTLMPAAPDPLRDAVLEAAHATGRRAVADFDDGDPEGVGMPDVSIAGGERASAYRCYLAPVLHRANLTVRTGARALRLIVGKSRVLGVEYRRRGETCAVHAGREVVLCGGAYNSPQLLMLSGIGDVDALRAAGVEPAHHLPGVGRNLQEHASVPLRFAATTRNTFHRQLRVDRAAVSVLRWGLFRSGPMTRLPLAAMAYHRTREGLDRPDIQVIYSSGRLDDRLWFPVLRPGLGHFISAGIAVARPASRGWVKLRSADPEAPPRIQLNLLAEARDRVALREGLKAQRDFFRAAPLASLVGAEVMPGPATATDAEIDARLPGIAGAAHHPAGTCAMGTGDEAVVDAELRVRGLAGLRIADASVMPRLVGANTYATVIMIGEKAADLILGKAAA